MFNYSLDVLRCRTQFDLFGFGKGVSRIMTAVALLGRVSAPSSLPDIDTLADFRLSNLTRA